MVRTREAYVFMHRSAIACFALFRQTLSAAEFRAASTKKAADMRAKMALKTINKEITAPKIVLEKKPVERPRKAKVDLA